MILQRGSVPLFFQAAPVTLLARSFQLEVFESRHPKSESVSSSVMSDSLRPHGLYIAHQAPLSMAFFRQEYWSGLSFPSPGDFPNPGSNPGLLHCQQILYHLSHQ